jgi:uncharacterized protein (TIGR02246 family)
MMFSGCKQAPPDTHDADVKAIQDVETQWNKEYAAKDADKLANHYAEDAVVMMGDSPALVGKRAVLDWMMNLLRDPAFKVSFHATKADVAKSGDLAYTQGSYTSTVSDPITKLPIDGRGSYLTVYRKQEDGTWEAVEDVISPDTPPGRVAAPPAPKGKPFHLKPFE